MSDEVQAARPSHAFTFSTGRKAEIRELNGYEQFQTDRACESSEQIPIMYYRAAASLVKLGDRAIFGQFNKTNLDGRLQQLSALESDELVREYTVTFMSFSPDKLGNSSAADDSQPV